MGCLEYMTISPSGEELSFHYLNVDQDCRLIKKINSPFFIEFVDYHSTGSLSA